MKKLRLLPLFALPLGNPMGASLYCNELVSEERFGDEKALHVNGQFHF